MAVQREWDLRKILIIITRNWWWPVITLSMSFLSAWAYLRYTVATYSSDAVVQIDFSGSIIGTQRSQESGIDVLSLSDAYLELFTSYELVHETVNRLKLNWEIYSIGRLGQSLVFPAPFKIEIDSANSSEIFWSKFPIRIQLQKDSLYTIGVEDTVWGEGKFNCWQTMRGTRFRIVLLTGFSPAAGAIYQVSYLSPSVSTAYWQSRLSVIPKRGISVLQLIVTDRSATRAQQFLHTLLETSREYERYIKQARFRSALAQIDTFLQMIQKETGIAQDTLLRFEQKNDMLFLPYRKQEAFSAYGRLRDRRYSTQQEELKQLSNRVRSLLDTLRNKPEAPTGLLFASSTANQFLSGPVQAINSLIERRNQLLRVYQPASLWIQPIHRKLEILVQDLANALDDIIKSDRILVALLNDDLHQGREIAYKSQVLERHASVLETELNLKQSIYKLLLERKIQLSIDKEAVISSIRITQPPRLPGGPISPNPVQVYAVAIGLGIVLGIGGILLKEIVNQKISYRVDIEEMSPVPVLGEIPYDSSVKGAMSFSSLQLEVLRSLRSALGFLWEENAPRIVIVTSTVSGEGKTFVAQGIAHVHALAGYRTLLVDADLRRASLSRQLGTFENGLSILLSRQRANGHSQPNPLIGIGQRNLFVLPAGPVAPNPPELLESSAFSELLLEYAKQFDYIVLDTAPMGLVPDTLTILRHLPYAVTLYIFRADYSRIPFLNHLEEVVRLHHLKKTYLLFNGTKLSRPRYGYGYGYGYYGRSYGERKYYHPSSTSWWKRVREWLPL
ncbi:MAG: hypothetical protein NZ580_02835 [Bacteroidia bacterium]|nr:hypothetical protein [Bacteroidia bacterium]MDW8235721.1 GNVR domain-containing protein [Bacteroidia bacterium]